MNVEWTLLPDVNHQDMWPREATHFEVIATYKDSTSFNTRGTMNSPQKGPLTVKLEKIPAGGEIMFAANFYSESNWLCGNVSTGFMQAEPSSNKTMIVPKMNIKEKLIPLTADTQYLFNNTLKYNGENKQYEWSNKSGASTATIKNLSASNIGHNLANPLNITLSQNTRQLAYTWQASGQNIPLIGKKEKYSGQMWVFQSIDTGSNPQSNLKIVENGFQTQPLIVYDLYGSDYGTGCNYYIDPRKEEYHLRPIGLDEKSGVFNLSTGKSFGRFNEQVDACVVHPSGYAVGISNKNSKIEVLNISKSKIYQDKDAPLAEIYSGYGSIPGKIHNPIGIACLPDAGILVLENKDSNLQTEARIQAFDLLGNPVKTFLNYTSSFKELREEERPVTYLDIDVESKGFIYVLKYLGNGGEVSDYLLDIYYPDGSFLTQTKGISASKIAVDIWRALFTLNFEVIEKPDDGRTEPSVSIWLPSTP